MKLSSFQRFVNAFMSVVMLCSSIVFPFAHANAQSASASNTFNTQWRDQCSISDCSFTERVPVDNWSVISTLPKPQGDKGRAEGSSLYQGEQWMALGDSTAGLLGLSSSQVVLDFWKGQTESPPWVVARYIPEKAELRISAVKTIKTPDGLQQLVTADFTPHHGAYSVVRRHYLTASEESNPYTRGQHPFTVFRGVDTDPVFHHINPGAADVALGLAMAHFGAPYAMFVDSGVRIPPPEVRKSGGWLKKTITTTTYGYAKPKFYFVSPWNMSTLKDVRHQGQISSWCPRGRPCALDELVFAGIFKKQIKGGNTAQIEEEIYKDVQQKSSWTGLAMMLVVAAAVWTGGALMAGTGFWSAGVTTTLAEGTVVTIASTASIEGAAAAAAAAAETAAAATTVIGGGTVAGAAGATYGVLDNLYYDKSLSEVQAGAFNQLGLNAAQVPFQAYDGLNCTSDFCQNFYPKLQARHVDPTSASGTLKGSVQTVDGVCPPSLTTAQCQAQGLSAGILPRVDSYQSMARNSEFYAKKKALCISQGYGKNQVTLYSCMASGIVLDNSSGTQ